MKRKIVSWFLLHKLFGYIVENKAFCLNGVYHVIDYYNQKRGRTMLFKKEDGSTKFIDVSIVEKMTLDYVNNFLTVGSFAEYYDLELDSAEQLISSGLRIIGYKKEVA